MEKYNLEIGKEYKTNEVYKNIFGKELAKGGNTRKKQIENINCFLKFEKGNKRGYIKIIEFLDKPLQVIEDKRIFNKGGNNIDTIVDLETIIMYLVNEQIKKYDNKSLLLSKSNALVVCNLIHDNYKKARLKTNEVAQELNINEEYLKEFFIKNHTLITRKLERALQRLHSKRCINFKQCFIIIQYDEQRKVNIHRVANNEEADNILTIEANILKELGLNNKGEVYIRNIWKTFKRKCEELFNKSKNENYIGYYEGYEIRGTKDSIKRAIDVFNYDIAALEVNSKILKQCDKNMETTQLKILNHLDGQINSLKSIAFGEPPKEFIDKYEKQKEIYKGINLFLIKGETSKEFKNAMDKDAIEYFK